MKQLYLKVIFFSFFIYSTSIFAQNITADLFEQPANTGANMTVAINTSSLDQYEGGQIGAFYDINGDGNLQCVGLEQITTGFFGLALWGDDSFTTEADGLSAGDVPLFAVLFEGNVIPFNTSPQFTGYITNGWEWIVNITYTDLPICELDQWLLPFEGNTGSNMTLLLHESFVTSLNILTNNAYILATTETGLVVGSSYLNNSQTSLVVWGDDSFTPEINGATDGQLINLHLIDSNLLYNVNTSFNYVTNNLDVISNEASPVLTCSAENLGCTDQNACNFNVESIIEDGSCNYSETYYTCNGNCINDSDADGICDELEVPGCTNPIANNYNSIATDDDGTCIFLGCTDQEACNWDNEANTDDGSCIYAEIYFNCDGICINDFDLDGECDEIDYDDGIGINEVESENAQLIKIIDVLGREYKEHIKGVLMFYIYKNGKVEKRVTH